MKLRIPRYYRSCVCVTLWLAIGHVLDGSRLGGRPGPAGPRIRGDALDDRDQGRGNGTDRRLVSPVPDPIWLGLAQARDKDGDGAIVLEELRGPAELFHRLDRNHDGVIKAEDLDWTPQSAFLRQQATARRRFAMMDSNANGRVSKEEWDAFFVRAAKGKSGLTLDALGDALDPLRQPRRNTRRADRDASQPQVPRDGLC